MPRPPRCPRGSPRRARRRRRRRVAAPRRRASAARRPSARRNARRRPRRWRRRRGPPRRRAARSSFRLAELVLRGAQPVREASRRRGEAVGVGAKQRARVLQEPIALERPAQRPEARHRLDAPGVGADRGLRDELDRADRAERAARGSRRRARASARPPRPPARRRRTCRRRTRSRPSRSASLARGLGGVDRLVAEHVARSRSRIARELLVGDAARWLEVEAQAVGRDEGALLVDVVAQHVAQRRVQQVGGGVVASDRPRAGRASIEATRLGRGGCSPVTRSAVRDRRPAAAAWVSSTRRTPVSVTMSRCRRPGRRPRRRRACGRGRPRRSPSVAFERRPRRGPSSCSARASRPTNTVGPLGVEQGAVGGLVGRRAGAAAPPARARAARPSRASKPARSTRDAALGGDLLGELDREAVGVVQAERDVAVSSVRSCDRADVERLVEERRARCAACGRTLLLGSSDRHDEVAVADERRVRDLEGLDGGFDERGVSGGVDRAVAPRGEDRAADDPPQHVAAPLVGREDAVGDEDRHRPAVVGDDAERDVGRRRRRRSGRR